MTTQSILIFGSGHLAARVRALAQARGHRLVPWAEDPAAIPAERASRFADTRRALDGVDLEAVTAALLVDERDDRNFELAIVLSSLRSRLPIVASMFNENIAPHLQAANPNLRILNPARIATETFADALDQPMTHRARPRPRPPARPVVRGRRDRLIPALVAAFVVALLGATAYFHHAETLSWIDAFYFVVVTVATVGYGDISLLHSSTSSKMVGIGLILASTVFIWMIFSLTVDQIIKHRVQMALGRRRHSQRGHVILCGVGRLGHLVGEALLQRGERLLVVEQSENSEAVEHLRTLGADVYVGDARSPRVLEDAGVARARALYSLVANDFVNLEVGLNARSFEPDLRVVLRIFDEAMAQQIKEQLDIELSFSMSAIADEPFVSAIESDSPVAQAPRA